jgi:hypothetical protein
MKLSSDQVKSIAERVRALPDAVLAEIGLERVIEFAAKMKTSSQEAACVPPHEDVIYARVAKIVAADPGIEAREIRKALGGMSISRWVTVGRVARELGLVQMKGPANHATYWPCAAKANQ